MTTTIMMEAVKAGVGRETAHEAIKEHALATVNDLRHGEIDHNNLVERLAGDTRLGLSRDLLDAILARGDQESGAAKAQIAAFAAAVRKLEAANPAAAAYGRARFCEVLRIAVVCVLFQPAGGDSSSDFGPAMSEVITPVARMARMTASTVRLKESPAIP